MSEELIHTNNVITVISALNGDNDFVNVYNNLMKEGKEPKSMFEMIERIKNAAKAEGIAEGKAAGLAEGEARGEARGKAEGFADGFKKKAIETAQAAISMGLSIDKIMTLTNLPEKTILQLM